MSSDLVLGLQAIFTAVFQLGTSWQIPGTHMSPFGFGFFCLSCLFVVKFIKVLLSVHGSDD